jgi:ferrous iron transport protein B
MVTVDVLLGRRHDVPRPDAVLCIVDASNLERNLYLVSQVLELGLPTVVALNMVDLAQQRGITIDVARLERQLGARVIEVQANRRMGIEALKTALAESAAQPVQPPSSPFPPAFQEEVARLAAGLSPPADNNPPPRYLVERLLLDTTGYLEGAISPGSNGALHERLQSARSRLAAAGTPVPAVEAIARYGWVAQVLDGVITRPAQRPVTFSDRLDRVLTHKFWGTWVFAVVMVVVFQSVFRWAEPAMGWIESLQGLAATWVESSLAAGAFRSLLVDGVIAGVGGVLIFLPQIFILFFFMAVLEDCGYMARAAYLMDKLMSRVGLSGKSFIPLLSSFACAIPGVMATRVIENRRDRLTTILVAPLMSCSARLPVYAVMIGAFIPDQEYAWGLLNLRGLTLVAMYVLGIVTAVVVALALKKTLLRGATPPFVMELPTYKWPSPRLVIYRMLDRGWAFVQRAGTLILMVSILIWAMLYYPRDIARIEAPYRAERESLEKQLAETADNAAQRAAWEARLAEIDHQIAGEQQRNSILGRLGRFIEPAVRPLGWDWRIGSAVIASFPAREVVVATLGVIYNLGPDIEDEEGGRRLEAALKSAKWDGTDRLVYNVPVALSILVFFALCAQCASTLVIIKRETNSWRWPLFTFTYMTTLAYVGALATYQIGMLWIGS